jgi:O-antigen/teichoic acid export membrane protein
MSVLRQFSRDTLLYGLGKGLKKFIGLLLLPFYTRALSPAEFGILDTLGAMMFFISVFLTLGLDSSSSYFYFKTQDEKERGEILFTSFCLRLLAIVPSLFLSFFSSTISLWLFKTEDYTTTVLITLLLIPANVIMSEQELIYRFNRRAWGFNIITIAKSLCNIVGGLLLVVHYKTSVSGAQLASLLSTILVILISFFSYTRFRYVYRFSIAQAKQLVRFGFPLIWASLGVWVYSVSDRFFLMHYNAFDDIGFYSIGSTFSQPLGLFNMAIQMSFGVLFYEIYHKEDSPEKERSKSMMRNILYIYVSLALLISVLLSVFSFEIIKLVATEKFINGIVVIPVLTLSLVFAQSIEIVPAGISLAEKTWHYTWIITVAAIVNAGLNFIFIPMMGFMGAAITTLLANLTYFVLADLVSSRYFDSGFSRWRIYTLAGLTLCLALFFPVSEIYYEKHFGLGYKFAGVVIYLFLPFALGVLSFNETLKKIKSFSGKAIPKKL